MDLDLSMSDASSPHPLIANVSSLVGIVIFLQWIWQGASLEHTFVSASGAGLAVYLILSLGYAAAKSVLRFGRQADENESTSQDYEQIVADGPDTSAENVSESNDRVAEPQAA